MALVAATSGLKSPLRSINICSLFSPELHCSLVVVVVKVEGMDDVVIVEVVWWWW